MPRTLELPKDLFPGTNQLSAHLDLFFLARCERCTPNTNDRISIRCTQQFLESDVIPVNWSHVIYFWLSVAHWIDAINRRHFGFFCFICTAFEWTHNNKLALPMCDDLMSSKLSILSGILCCHFSLVDLYSWDICRPTNAIDGLNIPFSPCKRSLFSTSAGDRPARALVANKRNKWIEYQLPVWNAEHMARILYENADEQTYRLLGRVIFSFTSDISLLLSIECIVCSRPLWWIKIYY